ncbi:sel1 repeat family protein [Limnobaculum zhutongyuii]|uniref:Sel1 repeat family protein n=1 Tax=Limnobaculum zhutongyuii TaxID=2498113 RepID=A0A411WQE1_9GAMM|nr:sel1 repeat family protein [Limnobaculum zhutongyuii]QBH98474.1 sel1 repeat family protein [Limnobaculum zhutongyuii]TQS90079.1 sel1 repeat family protein [Limnobaculum zhutongyuii]
MNIFKEQTVNKVRVLWIGLLVCILSGCNDKSINHVLISQDSPRVSVQGSIPPNTALNFHSSYSSTQCSETRLITPGGDFLHPKWIEQDISSSINKVYRASSVSQKYDISVPTGPIGSCKWRLDSIKATFVYTDNTSPQKDDKGLSYSYTFTDSANVDEDANRLALNPTIYPIDINSLNNGVSTQERRLVTSDSRASEWFQANRTDYSLNFSAAKNIAITLTPVMDSDYRVQIDTFFESSTKDLKKYSSRTIKYPDGTTYFYSTEKRQDAPKGAIAWYKNRPREFYTSVMPESRIHSLMQSNDPAAQRLLAQIYESGNAIPESKQEAKAHYLIAAKGGDIAAMLWMLSQAKYSQNNQDIEFWKNKLAKIGSNHSLFEQATHHLCIGENTETALNIIDNLADMAIWSEEARSFNNFWRGAGLAERQKWLNGCRDLKADRVN